MLSPELVGVIAALLALLPQICTYAHHAVLLVAGNRKARIRSSACREKAQDISIILPIRKEPLEYVERALEYIGSLGLLDYEVIIVSDDEEADKERLLELVKEARRRGINVWFIWRSVPTGMRSGALNVGLFASRGRYVYVYDVDTAPDKRLFECGIEVLENCDECVGAVGRWEPLKAESRVSSALALGLRFFVEVLYNARSKLNLHIYPLGTGTLYKSDILKNVFGGWDLKRIQDDAELGARALVRGLKFTYLQDCLVRVENPSTYRSFRIQQARWAYGATDAAISRLRAVLSSKAPMVIRLEALLYMLQYLPQALSFTGALLLAVAQLVSPRGILESMFAVFTTWVVLTVVYSTLMYVKAWQGNLWSFAVLLGRLSAITASASPYITVNVLKALLRAGETYKRTPKGSFELITTSRRIPWELLFGLFFTASGAASIVGGYVLTGAFLFTYAAAFLYTTVRFSRDVFYK